MTGQGLAMVPDGLHQAPWIEVGFSKFVWLSHTTLLKLWIEVGLQVWQLPNRNIIVLPVVPHCVCKE